MVNFKQFNNMKKFIALVAMITAVATLSTSCEGVKTNTEYFADLVSIVDGTPESGNFYVIFDDKKTAYVTNSSSFTVPTSAYTDGEARAIIQYANDGEKSGYDKSIKIVEIFPIVTDHVFIKTERGLELNGMKNSFNIKNGYYSRGYINLALEYMYSEDPTSQDFYLAYNADPNSEENGLFRGHYMNDGYLRLELYRDPRRETSIETYDTYRSFKFDPKKLYIDNMDDYIGIKVLYRSMADQNDVREWTINF